MAQTTHLPTGRYEETSLVLLGRHCKRCGQTSGPRRLAKRDSRPGSWPVVEAAECGESALRDGPRGEQPRKDRLGDGKHRPIVPKAAGQRRERHADIGPRYLLPDASIRRRLSSLPYIHPSLICPPSAPPARPSPSSTGPRHSGDLATHGSPLSPQSHALS